ncbi:MAG: carbohydrate-binding protein [Bacteroidota bacterium]|nr:carbohydrate-binding protein [Bacteroidota bacterium]
MKNNILTLSILFLGISTGTVKTLAQTGYSGRAWHDSIQVIPGKVECEKYDVGGEGIAYHDADSVNNGSGKLNPDDGTYYNTFRINEGVDISYTKAGGTDDNPYNKVEPKMKQLYVGWTSPGEWTKYTVDVKESGLYQGTLMYTANADGKIALDIDGKSWLRPVLIQSTFNAAEPLAWRQWHHWNKQFLFNRLKLTKGKHVLTLKTIEKGGMNYDYIEFTKVK